MEKKEYSRWEDLTKKFNQYWNQSLKTDNEDYFKRLDIADIISMKSLFSNINNLITLEVTNKFIDYICKLGVINSEQADKIK
ncbi:MAG: hypothetical protein IJ180_11430 [Bacteroidales bacterium]|nr:hypothetical protein [Bacteroidales bacterium]MBQ9255368.1 hypothetical protein [Bacteroidales bacterium]